MSPGPGKGSVQPGSDLSTLPLSIRPGLGSAFGTSEPVKVVWVNSAHEQVLCSELDGKPRQARLAEASP